MNTDLLIKLFFKKKNTETMKAEGKESQLYAVTYSGVNGSEPH